MSGNFGLAAKYRDVGGGLEKNMQQGTKERKKERLSFVRRDSNAEFFIPLETAAEESGAGGIRVMIFAPFIGGIGRSWVVRILLS
jgi:hypothetical protein